MATYTEDKCRICRRQGAKLFLKGKRCLSPKCPVEKNGAVPPGAIPNRRRRGKPSEYSFQLKEKQKMRRFYGILERQFRKYFTIAKNQKGATGEILLKILESRLDNVVFRMGLVPSRSQSKQLISHGHILVNGKKVNIVSYEVKAGDIVSINDKGLKIPYVREQLSLKDVIIPDWLQKKAAVGKIIRLPKREEIGEDIDEKLVVEFYSR
jgi:small subunit ribosomal protein S4